MKQKLFLLMLVLAAMLSQAYSYPTVDTVWVKNNTFLNDAKFSPDGSLIYCLPDIGTYASKPFILSAANGDTVKVLESSFGGITAFGGITTMDLSKDGSLFIASNKAGDSLCLIDTKDYHVIRYFTVPQEVLASYTYHKGKPENVTGVTISKDNKYAAMISCGLVISEDPKQSLPDSKAYILVWDTETGKIITNIHNDYASRCVFSPRDNTLAVVVYNSGSYRIDLYNTDTWSVENNLCCHSREIYGIKYSADGRYLASWTLNNPCRIWDMDSKSIVVDNEDSGIGNNICFTNENNYIYINNNNQIVYGNISTKQESILKILGQFGLISVSSKNQSLVNSGGPIILFDLNNTNSVDNISTTEVITVSPNPSNGTANIQFTVPNEGKYNIDLIDMNGTIVKSFGSSYCNLTNNITLDLSGISSGAYFIKIWNDTYSKSYKLVIN